MIKQNQHASVLETKINGDEFEYLFFQVSKCQKKTEEPRVFCLTIPYTNHLPSANDEFRQAQKDFISRHKTKQYQSYRSFYQDELNYCITEPDPKPLKPG